MDEQARWDAVVQLAHMLDDAAQGITERQAYDFATRFRVLAGLDGPEAVANELAALRPYQGGEPDA
jgi:hypothetical protein